MKWKLVLAVACAFLPHATEAKKNCVASHAFDASLLQVKNKTWPIFLETYTCEQSNVTALAAKHAEGLPIKCWLSDGNADFNTGDVAWMMFATTFVMLQTPAAGFAQGGLVRRKNALSVIGQSFMGVVIGCLLWFVLGYSLTFGESSWNGFIGDIESYPFFRDVSAFECGGGDTIPHMLFACFQMTFALMVPVLVTGAWAEKFHFSSACLFMIIWPILVYYPTAHWIWGGGWLSSADTEGGNGVAGPQGVLDYAGGIVIHTSSGVSSLVVAHMLQSRRAFKQEIDDSTHNIPLTLVGVSLVWVGWYSFNGGSGLKANGQAAGALCVTQISACTAAAIWAILSKMEDGKVQITHIASGALCGLAGITPASGFVEAWAGIPIGIAVGAAGWFGGKFVKSLVKLDDVLDVTSLQAFPGAVGSILVGVFATSWSQPCTRPEFPGDGCEHGGDDTQWGVLYGGDGELLGWQFLAVFVVGVWAAVMTRATMEIIRFCGERGWIKPLNVSPEFEEIGLDISDHGEKAYDLAAEDDETNEAVRAAKLCNKAAVGDIDGCKQLIKAGVNPKHGDVDGRTPLHIAANKGYINLVQMFVNDYSVNVNVRDNWGNTPLKEATRNGCADVIAEIKSKHGTMFHSKKDQAHFLDAASNGNSRKVEALLKAGADPNTYDYDKRTALHVAASSGDETTVKLLLQHGANAEALDRFDQTPADDAKSKELKNLLSNAAAGADVQFGLSVLPNSSVLPDLDAADTSTSTREVLQAAQSGDLKDLLRLKKKKVNMSNVADYDNRTALHLAAEHGNLEVVAFLLKEKNMDVNAQDIDYQTPLHCATLNGHMDVVELLKSNNAIIPSDVHTGIAMCDAAANNDEATLKMYGNAGISLSTPDYDQRTALHLAAANNHAELIRYLVSQGANINAKDKWGATPKDDAKRAGHDATARLLNVSPGTAAASADTSRYGTMKTSV